MWHGANVKMYNQLGISQASHAIELLGLRLVSLVRFTELDSMALSKEKTQVVDGNISLKKKIAENLNVVNAAEKTKLDLAQAQMKLSKALEELSLSQSEVKKFNYAKIDL